MYYVYVLRSLISNHYYIGQTQNIYNRLDLHNSGQIFWSRRYKPWRIQHKEEYKSRTEAVKREKYLKSHTGRNWLKKNMGK